MGKLIRRKRAYLEGEWLEHTNPSHQPYIGRKLSFDDLEKMVGQLFILTSYTESRRWLKVCRVHHMIQDDTTFEGFHRRLVFTDGKGEKHCGLISEYWFTVKDPLKGARAYELRKLPPVGFDILPYLSYNKSVKP